MPKKGTSSSRIAAARVDGAQAGYFVYSDGSSYWGVGVFKGETPLKANKAVHGLRSNKRETWYNERVKYLASKQEAAKK